MQVIHAIKIDIVVKASMAPRLDGHKLQLIARHLQFEA